MRRTLALFAAATLGAASQAQGLGIAEVLAEGHITGPLEYSITDLAKAPNGDLVFLGHTDDGSSNELWVTRTTPNGNVIWTRTFPRPGGPGELFAHKIAIGADGKIYTVSSVEGTTTLRDFYYLSLNGVGIKLDERVVDHFDNDYDVGDLQVAADGSVFFCGGGLSAERPLVVKMNANLGTIWAYTMGSASAVGDQFAGELDIAADGSVVASATTNDGTQSDAQFVRLQSNGTFVYERIFGHPTLNDADPKVLLGSDGFTYFTYTRGKFTLQEEARLSQYDSSGVFQWNKIMPGYTDSQFAEAPDGTFVFSAVQNDTPWSLRTFKFDTAGTILWSTTTTRPNLESHHLEQLLVDDNGYITLRSFPAELGKVGGDYLVTGLSANGTALYEWTHDTGPGNYDIPTGLAANGLGEVVITGFSNGDTHTFQLRPVLPVETSGVTIRLGRRDAGDLNSLKSDDNNFYRVCKFIVPNQTVAPVNVEFESTVLAGYPIRRLEFETVCKANTPGLQQDTQLWNWLSSSWDTSVFTNLNFAEVKTVVPGLNDPHVEGGTRRVRARVRVKPVGPVTVNLWCVDFDKVGWKIYP